MRKKKRTKEIVHSRSGTDALLLIDVLNDLEFDGGEKVLPWAEKLVKPLRSICAEARRAGIPVIYVNDHHGDWLGDREKVIAHSLRSGARGSDVCRRLQPRKKDYFLLKPRHSAFFGTSLLSLLEELRVRRLILTGISTNLCVLITAHDAVMHGYPIMVLSDCCAAESDFDHNVVLRQLERYFKAEIRRSDEIAFSDRRRKTRA